MAGKIWALKEWAAAVAALGRGDTIVLLRKGGIREPGFDLAARQILLYPTHSHQDSQWLKPEFAARAADPPTVTCWAEVVGDLTLTGPSQVAALWPFHIWTEAFIERRLAWQPERPLQLLLLRAYALTAPVELAARPRGCRSWFELPLDPAMLATGSPALAPARFEACLQATLAALEVSDPRFGRANRRQ